MWLNSKEEATFGPFLKYIYEHEDNNFRFTYADGTELVVYLHLYEFESDNGLDINEDGYEEYWEMAFEIIKVIKDDKNLFSTGDKVLVNYHTVPDKYEIEK